jgi:8-oxo-dGTP diphosphatase
MRVRSVAVVIDHGDLLVIRRRNSGHDYAVLPGGGVERGETAGEACLRELREETGLAGMLRENLPIRFDETGPAHYFLVTVDRRELELGGPELSRVTPANSYEPAWVPLNSVELIGLVPEIARDAVAAGVRLKG